MCALIICLWYISYDKINKDMDFAKRMEIAKRQEERHRALLQKRERFSDAEEKYRQFFLDIDKNEAHLFGDLPERKTESTRRIIELLLKNPEEYKRKTAEIHAKYPQLTSSEFTEALKTIWKYQYEYYKELVDYLNMTNEDYETLFSPEYKKKTFEMAKNGLFLFYEETPDMEKFLTDDTDKNIEFVLNYISMDDFGPLRQMLMYLYTEEDPSDFLRTVKTRDFKEAIACLINGCYGSCARTMLALIENEHTNASNINRDFFEDKITKGADRDIELSKQLGEIHVSYFAECWKLMNDYYQEITANSAKKSTRYINRNEVVHGVYWDAILPDKKACTELVLFYVSFKAMSFLLQEVYDMRARVNEEFDLVIAKELSERA